MGYDPVLVLVVVQQLGLACIAGVFFGVQDGTDAWLEVGLVLAVVSVLGAMAARTVVAAGTVTAGGFGFGHGIGDGFTYFHQAFGNTLLKINKKS